MTPRLEGREKLALRAGVYTGLMSLSPNLRDTNRSSGRHARLGPASPSLLLSTGCRHVCFTSLIIKALSIAT